MPRPDINVTPGINMVITTTPRRHNGLCYTRLVYGIRGFRMSETKVIEALQDASFPDLQKVSVQNMTFVMGFSYLSALFHIRMLFVSLEHAQCE